MMKPFVEEPLLLAQSRAGRTRERAVTFFLVALSLIGLGAEASTALKYARHNPGIISIHAAFVLLWTAHLLIVACFQRGTGSIAVALSSIAVFASQAVFVLVKWADHSFSFDDHSAIVGSFASLVSFVVTVFLPLRDPASESQDISKPFTQPTKALRSPEDGFKLWHWITVSWISPLFNVGNKRQLEDSDVWRLPYVFQHRHLHDAFRLLKGKVLSRVIYANRIDIIILVILALLDLATTYAIPLLLQQFLQSLKDSSLSDRRPIMFAVFILAARQTAAQSSVFGLWFGRRCYERSRGEMITMLYEKTLNRRILAGVFQDKHDEGVTATTTSTTNGSASETSPLLPKTANTQPTGNSLKRRLLRRFPWLSFEKPSSHRLPTSTGKLLNLMKSDIYEVAQRFWEIQGLVNKPLGLILSIALTWKLLGWPCFVGIGLIIIAQGINALLARIIIPWERRRRTLTDNRLQQSSQFIELLRHLRWYGCQQTWLDRVLAARQKELNLRIVTFVLQSLVQFVNLLSMHSLAVVTFWAYTVLAGRKLGVDVAFPALQLFVLLRENLSEVPNLIMVLINASVAMMRIQDFIDEPDKVDQTQHGVETLALNNACFAWPGLKENVLRNITLEFKPGLNVVYGPVAAGKTALLLGMLSEMDLTAGEVSCSNREIGYCAQTPWLQSDTIRNNILFFSPLDPVRYASAIKICQLEEDFATFERGDKSPIGENGIGLSGGQKARLALARAIYSNSQILLLDDPLSALDHQTAEAVLDALAHHELLKGRTVVLVTHRIDICQSVADQLIEIKAGTARVVDEVKGKDSAGASDSSSSQTIAAESSGVADKPDDFAKGDIEQTDRFEEEEHRAHGSVKWSVYWTYIKAGSLSWWAIVLLGAILVRLSILVGNWTLKEWTEAYDRNSSILSYFEIAYAKGELHTTDFQSWWNHFFDRFPDPNVNPKPWLVLLAIIAIFSCFSFLLSEWTQLVVQYLAGKRLYIRILTRVNEATFRFYDVTPVGRLMNRLTSDMGVVDGGMTRLFVLFSFQASAWVASLLVIASVAPLFLLIAGLVTLGFVFTFLRFLPTSQSLRRLEMASLSPLMSNFGALVHGLVTVRAHKAQSRFQDTVIGVTDTFQRMDHFYWTCQTWLMYRFDILSALSTFSLTILAVRSNLSAGLTAFILTVADSFVNSTHMLCKVYGQLQLDFVSVERVIELLEIEQEPPGYVEPPALWPSSADDIRVENLTIRYGPNDRPALRNISLKIKAGKTTAIIGRTGSGKSTLALTLLGAVPAPETGTIKIGHCDVNQVSKQALRSRITFLAQDPMLFPGSLQDNLDPGGIDSTADECASAIEAVGGAAYGWTPQTHIEAGGRNLSQGQRQLVSLARAILRRSQIVIMDEATASVDLETSAKIMKVLRTALPHVTLVVIAHRQGLIKEADDVIELANGEVCLR